MALQKLFLALNRNIPNHFISFMKATIKHNDQTIEVDLSKPIDISIPLTNTDENPIAWYIEKTRNRTSCLWRLDWKSI